MFNTIRNFFTSNERTTDRLLWRVERHDRERRSAKQASADRKAVSSLASVVNRAVGVFEAWASKPSAGSSLPFDIFLSRAMAGFANAASDVACYLTQQADDRTRREGLKTDAERKAAQVAQAVGSVHMMYVDGLMTEGKRVSLVVDAAIASDIASAIHRFCMQDVEIRDCSEPGKSVLVVHDASNGGKDDESVH